MADVTEVIQDLVKRVEALEKQVALLKKPKKPTPSGPARDGRDRYDSLDYPE